MNKSTFLASVAILGAALTASAQEPIPMGNENRVIEAGQPYSFKQYEECSGIYTAPISSTIYVDGAGSITAFNDPEHKDATPVKHLGYGNGGQVSFEAEADKTYYFYAAFTMDEGIFLLYQDGLSAKPLDVYIMQPAPDQLVDFNNYPDMEITFNQDVQIAKPEATISFNNRLTSTPEDVTVRASVNGQMLRVPMFNTYAPTWPPEL